MLHLNKKLHILKRDISYLGYINRNPPVVITFERMKDITTVQKKLTLSNYEVKYHPYKDHFKLERNIEQPGYDAYSIETKSRDTLEKYLTHHNIDMFIVCDMIEDEDNNMILHCKDSKKDENYY